MSVLYSAIAFGICVCPCILLAMRLGKANEKEKIMEANVEALKKKDQTVEAIINHRPGDGVANLKRLSQRKRK